MSDWCYWMEGCLLRVKKVLEEKRFEDMTDQEFYRLLYNLGRIRRGEWKEGQI